MSRLILASASPIRAQILRAAGVAFEIIPAYLDEVAVRNSLPPEGEAIADALAELKARYVSALNPGAWAVGADQVLMLDHVAMSKAETLEEAFRHLRKLRGRSHVLVASLVLARDNETLWRHAAEAELVMRDFSDSFLSDYLAREGEAVLGGVGCYRLVSLGAQLFDRIEGDYFSILGMPLLPLLKELRTREIIPT